MMSNSVRARLLMLALFSACGVCAAQQQQALSSAPVPADAAKASTSTFSSRTPRYRIQPGDTFDVTFDLSPEFNQTAVAVQPDGFVTLRSIGDVKVAGRDRAGIDRDTAAGIREDIEQSSNLGSPQGFRKTILRCWRPGEQARQVRDAWKHHIDSGN